MAPVPKNAMAGKVVAKVGTVSMAPCFRVGQSFHRMLADCTSRGRRGSGAQRQCSSRTWPAHFTLSFQSWLWAPSCHRERGTKSSMRWASQASRRPVRSRRSEPRTPLSSDRGWPRAGERWQRTSTRNLGFGYRVRGSKFALMLALDLETLWLEQFLVQVGASLDDLVASLARGNQCKRHSRVRPAWMTLRSCWMQIRIRSCSREASGGHRGHVPHCVGFWPPAQSGAWQDGGGGELGWSRISARPQATHVTLGQPADSDASAQHEFGRWW